MKARVHTINSARVRGGDVCCADYWWGYVILFDLFNIEQNLFDMMEQNNGLSHLKEIPCLLNASMILILQKLRWNLLMNNLALLREVCEPVTL